MTESKMNKQMVVRKKNPGGLVSSMQRIILGVEKQERQKPLHIDAGFLCVYKQKQIQRRE